MEANLKKGTKIKRIVFPDTSNYTVNETCFDITVVMENGQMSPVPWFLIKVDHDTTVHVNAANVESVEFMHNQVMSISDLELTVRSNNALKKAGINTVYELKGMSIDDLYEIPNIGHKSINEIVWSMLSVLNGAFEIREREIMKLLKRKDK